LEKREQKKHKVVGVKRRRHNLEAGKKDMGQTSLQIIKVVFTTGRDQKRLAHQAQGDNCNRAQKQNRSAKVKHKATESMDGRFMTE